MKAVCTLRAGAFFLLLIGYALIGSWRILVYTSTVCLNAPNLRQRRNDTALPLWS